MSKINLAPTGLDNRANRVKRTEEEIPKIKRIKSLIKDFGEVTNLSNKIIEKIDFKDKYFINRIYNDVNEIIDEDLLELKESIKQIGLINIIYLIRKKDDKYRIVSGLRRSLAISKLVEEGEDIYFPERVVIFEKDVPNSVLEAVSIDENLQRKNLTLLEQAYKFNKEAQKEKNIEEILEENKISKKHFYRIKKAMDYPMELKEVLEEIGITKAEVLNNIINLEKANKTTLDIIDENKNLTKEELYEKVKNIKAQRKANKEKIIYKADKNKIKIELNISESEEFLKIYKEFIEKIEKL